MDAGEYTLIKRNIFEMTGVDLDCYKEAQMQRRLRTYLLRSGHPSWHSLFKMVRGNPAELGKLRDYLTINVSSFFRDVDKFTYLQERILPALLRERPRLRIWSAGCSRGHEPYSLAILLAQMTGPLHRHYILATDIDESALAWAKAGGPYSEEDVANVSPAWRAKYLEARSGQYFVTEDLRRRMTFRQHNLLAHHFENDFDLIVCRNVIIYFTAEAKERLHVRFYEALHPGGILFVGGTEFIPRASELGFEPIGFSYYRHK